MSNDYYEKRNTWLYDELGMWKARWIACSLLGGVLVLTLAIFAIVIPVNSASCHQAAERIGTVTGHYKVLTGCYYRFPSGKEVPQSNYPPKYIHVGGYKE